MMMYDRTFGAMRRGLVLVMLPALLLGCGGEAPEQALVARPIKMLAVGLGSSGGSLEYPGSVSPVQEALMSFEVDGRIIDLPVVEGQRVTRGTILGRLDPSDYTARRNADLATRNAALADYERYQDLYASDAVSLQDLEVSRRNYEVAQATLAISEKAVNDTRLRALFTGVVARTLVEQFENVRAKQPVLSLQDPSGLEMKIAVPERDLVLAGVGLTLEQRSARGRPEVEIAALPGRRYPGRVTEFATAADPVTRTFEATIRFEPPTDVDILPGMTGRVVLEPDLSAGSDVRFWIPVAAVLVDDEGTSFVWIVDDGTMTVRRAPVTLGALSGGDTEILSGLDLGDAIAVSGVHQLREGMAVRRLKERG